MANALLIDLDSISDTRLGTVHKIDPAIAAKCIVHDHHKRMIDSFDGIEDDVYKEEYAKRDVSTLNVSIPTMLGRMIREYSITDITARLDYESGDIGEVILNTYPYRLSDRGSKLLLQGLIAATMGIVNTRLIHMSNEQLTPGWLLDNVAIMVKYDYLDWIEMHSLNGNLNKTHCRDLTLIGPDIYHNKEGLRKHNSEVNLARVTEEIFNPVIDLKLIAIRYFSAIVRAKPKENKD